MSKNRKFIKIAPGILKSPVLFVYLHCKTKLKFRIMKKLGIAILLFIISCIVPACVVVKSIKFTQDCAGYLKQAADANTPELALERLNYALNYVETHNLTKGYTSILWRTEDENIGFWYQNLKACQSELENCLEGTQLEKSNVLMKVRESLTDDGGEDGVQLTIPAGISRYPENKQYAFWLTLSFILMAVSLVWGWHIFQEEY